jgi:hypothetical protein
MVDLGLHHILRQSGRTEAEISGKQRSLLYHYEDTYQGRISMDKQSSKQQSHRVRNTDHVCSRPKEAPPAVAENLVPLIHCSKTKDHARLTLTATVV